MLLQLLYKQPPESPPDYHGDLKAALEVMLGRPDARGLGNKLRAYRRNAVKEYLVWRTVEQAFDWFGLAEGDYQPQPPDAKGLCHSVTFPGLVLNVPALLSRNGKAVLATLNAALKSKAHRVFVAELAARKTGKRFKR